MGKRRESRTLALKVLYMYELVGGDQQQILEDTAEKEDLADDKTVKDYAYNLITKVIANMETLNSIIEECTENWTISRMAVIDRNILRMAITEILLQDNVPDVVAIDEAIEIAKAYSTEDSGGFVNGILDYIVNNKKQFIEKISE
ncbi:MAG: transcription antitermination factor NusB [bacterium]